MAWGQSPEGQQKGEYNNFTQLQNGPKSGKPFMCKEIYGGFQAPEKYLAFCREFYKKSFDLGSTGMLVQRLPLVRNQQNGGPFAISWLSQSGLGNRDTAVTGRAELPNWCATTRPHPPKRRTRRSSANSSRSTWASSSRPPRRPATAF